MDKCLIRKEKLLILRQMRGMSQNISMLKNTQTVALAAFRLLCSELAIVGVHERRLGSDLAF
jgi:hypothetical protein